jgi:hypothetical protein
VKVRGCQCRARREGDGNPLGVTMNAYVHDIAKKCVTPHNYPQGFALRPRVLARTHTSAAVSLPRSFPHVGIVPFYNLTEPRFDFHEAGYCAFEGLRGKQPDAPPPYCWCALRACVRLPALRQHPTLRADAYLRACASCVCACLVHALHF